MRTSKIYGAAALSFLLAFGLQAKAQQETIFTTGIGDTVQAAMQNAATNALTQAVGLFIDVEAQMTRISEVRNGVSSMVSEITEDVRSFSNGSIRSIDVFEQRAENGLFIVSAAVTVELRDLQAQIQPLLSVESELDQGIFAAIITDYENASSRSEVFEHLVLQPILNLDGVTFSIGRAERLLNLFEPNNEVRAISDLDFYLNPSLIARIRIAQYMANIATNAERALLGGFNLQAVTESGNSASDVNSWIGQIEAFGIGMTYVPVSISVSESTESEIRNNLIETSALVERINLEGSLRFGRNGFLNQIFSVFDPQVNNDVLPGVSAVICLAEATVAECYLINGLDPSNPETPLIGALLQRRQQVPEQYPTTQVSILSSNELLAQYDINGTFDDGTAPAIAAPFFDLLNQRPSPNVVDYSRYISPYILIYGRRIPIVVYDLESTVYLGLNFDVEVLRSLDRISLDVSPAEAFLPHLEN